MQVQELHMKNGNKKTGFKTPSGNFFLKALGLKKNRIWVVLIFDFIILQIERLSFEMSDWYDWII